jgi:hypothetical protein
MVPLKVVLWLHTVSSGAIHGILADMTLFVNEPSERL